MRLWNKREAADWTHPIEKKLSVLRKRSSRSCIYKVPNKLRKVDEAAYRPRIVSIGPFHRSNTENHDHLQAMEEHKWWYMVYLFNRTPNPKEILVQCGEAMSKQEEGVLTHYAEITKFEPNVLLEIMLIDGCFILELFLRSWFRDFTEEDPISYNAWMVPVLQRDLALLENQIPFFILENLFKIIIVPLIPKDEHDLLTSLALSFFHPVLNLKQEAIRKKCSQGGKHLLDILHNFYLPTDHMKDLGSETLIHGVGTLSLTRTSNTAHCAEKLLPKDKESLSGFEKSATQLLEVGIVFKKGEEDCLLDISFNKTGGVIIIPALRIDEATKSLLKNLIAIEQSLGSTQQHITSYAILLKSLIRSPQDVEILQKKRIITNDLIEVEDVPTFFKNILREVVPKDFCFGKLCEEVNAYEKSWWRWRRIVAFMKVRWVFMKVTWAFMKVRWDRYIAVLRSQYFSTPWSFISFISAAVLLILTVVQTYYAVRSYQKSH